MDSTVTASPSVLSDAQAARQQTASEPIVRFHNLFPGCRPPQRAARDGHGTIPIRAYRHCEALCSAAAFGWHVFPPMDFQLVWDGSTDVQWTYDGAEGWYQLDVAQFPHFAGRFDESAPEDAKGYSPPFLANFVEPGVVQIWTGLVARTAPGWNLLLRPPANVPRDLGYEHFEGIIETDRWFGPLFFNVRLTRTGVPVRFRAGYPLMQVQPVRRATVTDALLDNFAVSDGLESFSEADWDSFRQTVVKPNKDPNRRSGAYAAESRKGKKREERSA
jgi:hypothetical protein